MFSSITNQGCIVYLDNLKKIGDRTFDAYVDFRLQRDLNYFINSSQRNEGFGEINTYLELRSLKTNKRLLPGCYYKLNLNLLNNANFTQNEESLFIGRSYELGAMLPPNNDSQELLQSHEQLNPEELLHNSHTNELTIQDLSNTNLILSVRNVDQANWNELLEGDTIKFVYDLGARLHANKNEVQTIFNSRKNELKRDKPILVLSHWDMDHIHCLRYADAQTIFDCFSKFVCIDMMKTLTSHNVYKIILKALGANNVYCIRPASRTNGITMHLWQRLGNIAFYKGEKSRNINYSGLCMFVRGNQKSANFTGDVKLVQAKNVYDQELKQGINTNEHILIAPHHGGDYGATTRHYSHSTTEVIISVGTNNSYDHPEPHMLSYLQGLCGNNIKRTDLNGDIIRKI